MKTRSITRYAIGAAPLSLILIASMVIAQQPKSTSRSNVNVTDESAIKPVEAALPDSTPTLRVTVDGQSVPVKKNGTTKTDTTNGSVTITNSEDDNAASGASNSNTVNLNVSTDTTNSSTHTTTTVRHNATTSNRSKSSVRIKTDENSNINVSP